MLKRKVFTLLVFTLLFTKAIADVDKTLKWQFPINRTHAGMLLGNSIQGLMVWGTDTLNITVGHAGFWDHTGGNNFTERINFDEFKSLVAASDEAGLRKAFKNPQINGINVRPQQLSAGMLQVSFAKDYKLVCGEVNLSKGIITIQVQGPDKKLYPLQIHQSATEAISWLEAPKALSGKFSVKLKPMYYFNQDRLNARNIKAPTLWGSEDLLGFTQALPQDLPLAMVVKKTPTKILWATAVSSQAKKNVSSVVEKFNVDHAKTINKTWWDNYWARVSNVKLDDPVLQEIVDYGLYKQACSTSPHGIACTLQGPFMEEYQLPSWSNDYHFNINEQLIYTPALASNSVDNFKPLIQLIDSLMPVFKKYGQQFFNNKDAILIPHAVDDRGQVVGDFVTGSIDHATTTWVAYMLWQHYQYSGDKETLRKLTYPLLKGAYEGFNVMLEESKSADGTIKLSLPISVSPEYGSILEGIGKNSSFQLAALHKVLQILPEAAAILNESVNPRWTYIEKNLPLYTTISTSFGDAKANAPERIALWENQDLEISHRHHSHLAAIYPFESVDYSKEPHQKIVEKSYWRWVYTGMGGWTGWAFGWASILQGRMGKSGAAISLLHYWRRNFVNEGRGTLHNSTNNGLSMFNHPDWDTYLKNNKNHEIMQIDAGFGALSAVLDLLVRDTNGEVYILPDKYWQWKNISFKRIRTSGGFLLSAKVSDGIIKEVEVESTLGGQLKLHPNLGNAYTLNGENQKTNFIQINLNKGEKVILKRNN